MDKGRTSGQQVLEYALCLAAVTAVLIGMQLYVKRGLQARYKAGAGQIFSGMPASTTQYDPYYIESSVTETRNYIVDMGFPHTTKDVTTNRSGWQKVGPAE